MTGRVGRGAAADVAAALRSKYADKADALAEQHAFEIRSRDTPDTTRTDCSRAIRGHRAQ